MEREGNLITGDSFLHIMHVHVHAAIAQTFMVVHMFLWTCWGVFLLEILFFFLSFYASSLRTLCRSLAFAAGNPCKNILRSLYEVIT